MVTLFDNNSDLNGFDCEGNTFPIQVNYYDFGNYYGFEIDGNRLFCIGGKIVTHNTIQSEELRGQLSERLPGAFNIMAASMGVTTAQLGVMLKNGEVLAAEVLPKFADQLLITYGADKVDAIDSLTAAQNRLSNAWKGMVESLDSGSGAISQSLKALFNGMAWILKGDYAYGGTTSKENPTLKALGIDEQSVSQLKKASGEYGTTLRQLKKQFEELRPAGNFQQISQSVETNQEIWSKSTKETRLELVRVQEEYNRIKGIYDQLNGQLATINKTAEGGKTAPAVVTLRLLKEGLEKLNEAKLDAAEGQVASFDDKIKKLQATIDSFGKKTPTPEKIKLGHIEDSEIGDMMKGLGGDDFKTRDQMFDNWFAALVIPEEILAEQKEAFNTADEQGKAFTGQMQANADAINAIMFSTLDNLVSSTIQSLAGGGDLFKGIKNILGQGLIDLGEYAIAHSAIMVAIKKAISSPFGAPIGFGAGALAIAAGAALKASAAKTNKSMGGGGGGGGYGSSGGGGSFSTLDGQSIKLAGEFVIKGKDLVYVMNKHENINQRTQARG
jgi:tape measure domain-containing protein